MQLAWSRIWTRVAVSISYDDNHYITGTSTKPACIGTVEKGYLLVNNCPCLAEKNFIYSWQTVTESNLKVLFSIATTPRCMEERYSFPWVDPYIIMLGVKQGGIKYRFLSFWCDSTWIEPRFPEPLANTLTTMRM